MMHSCFLCHTAQNLKFKSSVAKVISWKVYFLHFPGVAPRHVISCGGRVLIVTYGLERQMYLHLHLTKMSLKCVYSHLLRWFQQTDLLTSLHVECKRHTEGNSAVESVGTDHFKPLVMSLAVWLTKWLAKADFAGCQSNHSLFLNNQKRDVQPASQHRRFLKPISTSAVLLATRTLYKLFPYEYCPITFH